MLIQENGTRYVKHHLIDFASSLGAGAGGAVPRFNFEYTVDAPAVLGRAVALGFHEDDWRYVERPPGLPEVGFFESDRFDPLEWKPLAPNTAFSNLTDRDGYWAAKIISAFTDQQIREIVAFGRYADPKWDLWKGGTSKSGLITGKLFGLEDLKEGRAAPSAAQAVEDRR